MLLKISENMTYIDLNLLGVVKVEILACEQVGRACVFVYVSDGMVEAIMRYSGRTSAHEL